MPDLIGIGLTGLRTHQTALSVTGNNVANTNTPGYSRQEAVFVDNKSVLTGAGYIGQGVTAATVRRNAEEYLTEQVRADTTIYSEMDAVLEQAEAIDNLLASTTTGLTPAMSSFFKSFQGGADDPTSIPQRQLMLTQTEGLVSRFHSLDTRLNDQMDSIDDELQAAVAAINSMSQALAELNQSISLAIGAGQGDLPNDLMDKRDETLRELSEYVNVTVFPTEDPGQVNVFIGNGQPLVLGNSSAQLGTAVSPEDAKRQEITFESNGRIQIISNELSGGRIGGLLDFRNNELSTAINSLGRIAIAVSETVNKQNSIGMDLEDNLGGLIFRDINEPELARARVTANANNVAPQDHVLQINIINSGELSTDDYELRFEGPTDSNFAIVRKSTSEIVQQGVLPGIFPARVEVEGFEIQFDSGTYKIGDRFLITPTKNGAESIEKVIDRVESIAFASPIRADASIGNTGNANISLGTMLDVESPLTNTTLPIFSVEGQLSPPLEIEFLTPNRYQVLDVSDPANPVPLSPPINNQLYNPGVTNTIFTSDPGQTMVMASGADALSVPAPAASAGPLVNGFGAQNLSILTRDTDTGVVTSTAVPIAANMSAQDIATSLQAISGIQATAYTQVRIDNFNETADGTPLGFVVNGETITIPADSISTPDDLARLINENTALQDLDIYAVSDGNDVEIHATSGIDLVISATGGATDSFDVSAVDPYAAGAPSLSTQTVTSGDGVAVGGAIDVMMADGISMTADVDSVFSLAPVSTSTYFGFQFELRGQAAAGDSFTISYNTGGVSDNRNALALAGLETAATMQNEVISFGEAYSSMIEEIGTVTNKARLDTESAKALLTQSENYREQVSGVSLDEEAGRLIQFQSAYNASAQVVSVARELFNTLLGVFR